MNIAQILADKLEESIGETVYVGRIPGDKEVDGQWAVIGNSGAPEGGNIAKYKLRTQLQVMLMHKNPQVIYSADSIVKKLAEIPYENDQFIDVSVGGLQDQDLANSERRVGVWAVETLTFNVSEETGGS